MEASAVQALTVCRQRLGNQHVFERSALLANLEFAIPLRLFKAMIQVDKQLVQSGVRKLNLLGDNQQPARPHPVIDFAHQCLARRRLDELQGKVKNHHRGVFYFTVAQVFVAALDSACLFAAEFAQRGELCRKP